MSAELLRIVDSIHRDKNIDKEIVYSGIEAAIATAAKKHFGEETEVVVNINRQTGAMSATQDGKVIDAETLGRISAQLAKQIIIQKIREAERDSVYDEFISERGKLHTGVIQRQEGNVVTVHIGKVEAILPRSEQMPGENYRPGDRIRAVITDVRKSGQRVKIVLSRSHPDLVRRLFEQEIPEIAEHIIEIRSIAREAGYRTKVAVSSIDSKVDCVGACVGVRGNRIKNILDELGGERIDIIRYNESLQILIRNALAPAEIEEVQHYPRMGRAIVLVRDDQLSLAIGKRGQNVRLASKLAGVDIEIMTFDELTEQIDKAESNLSALEGITDEVVEQLIEEGILSCDDLSVMEVNDVMAITGLDEEGAEQLIAAAEEAAESAPIETTTRSSLLTNPVTRPSAASVAEKLLGPAEDSPKVPEKAPTVRDLFGEIEVEPKPEEQRITARKLFGDDTPRRDRSDD